MSDIELVGIFNPFGRCWGCHEEFDDLSKVGIEYFADGERRNAEFPCCVECARKLTSGEEVQFSDPIASAKPLPPEMKIRWTGEPHEWF